MNRAIAFAYSRRALIAALAFFSAPLFAQADAANAKATPTLSEVAIAAALKEARDNSPKRADVLIADTFTFYDSAAPAAPITTTRNDNVEVFRELVAIDPKGAPVANVVSGIDPIALSGDRSYTTTIDISKFKEPYFVHFALTAVGSTPDSLGTTIDIGGAVIGFEKVGDGTKNAARVVHFDGKTWESANHVTPLRVDGSVRPLPLAVRLVPGSMTWELYYKDIKIGGPYPLRGEPVSKSLSITISAGSLPGANAQLREIFLSKAPAGRSSVFAKTTDGEFKDGFPVDQHFHTRAEIEGAFKNRGLGEADVASEADEHQH